MKGSLNKSYDFPISVTADDLESLSRLLSTGFEELQYDINTKDGARYTLDSLDEVLKYSNPNDRKIQRICIKGNKKKGDRFVYPDIAVSLLDKSVYSSSCELEMKQLEETEISYYSQKVEEFAKGIRAPHWWLHKVAFYVIVSMVLYSLFAFLYLKKENAVETVDKVYSYLVLQGVSVCSALFTVLVLEKLVSWLFPACCFAIGEQTKHKERLNKVRNIVFIVIILAFVVGVLSGLYTQYIIQS